MRLTAFVALLLAALAFAPAAASAQSSAPPRIVAVGDLHGDYDAWNAILRAAGLINAEGRWAGGRTILVQTGDVVDRGPDSLKIIDQVMRLAKEAQRAGGKLIVLTGNHEAMMVTGDLRYVHPGEYAAFATRSSEALRHRAYERNQAAIEATYRKRNPDMTQAAIRAAWLSETPLGKIEHQLAWAPDGRLGRWAAANPAAVKIGDTLFVHGGISQAYAAMPLDEINRQVRAALQARAQSEAAIINDPLGPLWYRGLIMPTADEEQPLTGTRIPPSAGLSPEQELDRALAAYGVKRMVVGHTPSVGGIRLLHGGKLVQVDTGISRTYGGKPSYLEIVGDRLIPHEVPRL